MPPTLYNNLPVGEGVDLNISPTGYLIIEDVNRIDNTIRIKEPQEGANFQIDVYRTLEDTEVPLDTSAPSLYTVAAQMTLGDPCPPGIPCGEAANKAEIVRLPQQSLCCDDFDEEGVGPGTPVDPGGGGQLGGRNRQIGGTVEPPVIPPEPPITPDCQGDQESGFFGAAGCGYPDSCVCVGHCIEFIWHDNGYLSSGHDNCCEMLCYCATESGGCGINFRTCSSITARVCYGYDGPGSYCCSGGYCYSNGNGSSAVYNPYTGCMSLCRLGNEFRFSDGALRIGRCNCCPPCDIGVDPNGPQCGGCELSGVIGVVPCTPSTLNCYPFVEPECNCGRRRTWKKRYTCCTASSSACCCNPNDDNCICTWTEKSADTCAIYLEMDYIGDLGPHGYWYDGIYYGNCVQRSYLDCCCYCQDPLPACCGDSDINNGNIAVIG
tara:strand:+ start:1808 stop:3112 length:1305 start_codon:yes stop_codon:yes gene_type:complete